ncbi:MAG: tRNA uridine-5-carboxymethylaminomethyl(34) synthesis GTPase MnmE [bacterium]|nr:tRNA uridine-5-carboxymethylaminomethyl(34) synthesis GTPase MnmE [bacterium]
MDDTIAAIATSLSPSAISIIRVSGVSAIEIVDKIFSGNLKNKESHTISYGYIKENNEIIDEVLVTIMKAPKSFTTEDVIEINCHGGIATTKKVLELVIKNGARIAEPGEFTKRAFLNGRIDLTKAEAVQDLINVKSENARKIAMNNLTGKTNNTIKELRQKLREIISNIEVNIDYPEYLDIEEMTKEKIESNIDYIEKTLEKIINNSNNSKIIKNGINVAIVGRPNVGKSSILNRLLQEEKAIVTNVAGTTRDIVEGSCTIDGILLNFIDTAGIRKTKDIVEQIGVNKSLDTIEKSDLVIVVLNNNEKLQQEDIDLLEKTKNKKRIVVVNKDDLNSKIDIDLEVIFTNTLTDEGIDSLINKIKELFNLDMLDVNDFSYVSSMEQIKKLEEAKTSLESIKKALKDDLPIDMIEIDIKNIWTILGEIIGETYTEELLDNLFKDFCVGK